MDETLARRDSPQTLSRRAFSLPGFSPLKPRLLKPLRDSLAVACLLAVAGFLMAACGGSGGEPADAEEFAAAADRICAEGARRDVAARHQSLGSQAEYLNELRRIRKDALRELEGLRPPSEDAAGFEAFVDVRHEAAIRIEDGIEAALDGDVAALRAFRKAARERVVAAQRIAAGIGLEACSGQLPARERAAVGAAIDASVDPTRAQQFCLRHATESMVAFHFGSLTACVREQARRPASDAVAIDELYGVAGIAANAIVTVSQDGTPVGRYEITLVHDGAGWRYDQASPAVE